MTTLDMFGEPDESPKTFLVMVLLYGRPYASVRALAGSWGSVAEAAEAVEAEMPGTLLGAPGPGQDIERETINKKLNRVVVVEQETGMVALYGQAQE